MCIRKDNIPWKFLCAFIICFVFLLIYILPCISLTTVGTSLCLWQRRIALSTNISTLSVPVCRVAHHAFFFFPLYICSHMTTTSTRAYMTLFFSMRLTLYAKQKRIIWLVDKKEKLRFSCTFDGERKAKRKEKSRFTPIKTSYTPVISSVTLSLLLRRIYSQQHK